MKILLLCTKFSLVEDDPWLTNELAESLQESGHEVTVVNLDWSATPGGANAEFATSAGVNVVSLRPILVRSPIAFVSRILKWTLSSIFAYRALRRSLHNKDFDLVIGFSPAVTMALPIFMMTRRTKTKSFLVQWDFFPHHHQQIGLLTSRVSFFFAKKVEEFLMRRFDVIGCMSPANVNYLRTHYLLREDQNVGILPIWGKGSPLPDVERDVTRSRYGLPEFRPIIVFGGQLVRGRGLEDLLAAASLGEERHSPISFLVIGSGPLESLVTAYIKKGHGNLFWIPRVPRQEYLRIIMSCDIGLVCTVRDVDIPSFPSKTIDYLRAGLPIVGAVETATDYGDYLESRGVGVRVEAGRPEELFGAVETLVCSENTMRTMKERGPFAFAEEFDVDRVAEVLLELIENSCKRSAAMMTLSS